MNSIKKIVRLPMFTYYRGMQTSAYLSSTKKTGSDNQSPLFQLRQRTGLAYSLCREALNKHDSDVDKAENWLKAQALTFQPKIRVRSTREGIVGIAIPKDNQRVTVLELNCETDFVVKNQIFRDFALSLTEKIASMGLNCSEHRLDDEGSVVELRPPLESLETLINPIITRLGENIKINRASHYQSTDKDVQIFGQIHAQTGQKTNSNLDIMTGRFGAIVALKTEGRSVMGLGSRLCRHVIGYNPTYIELPDHIRQNLEEAEKQEASKEIQVEDNSDTEDNIIHNSRDDWPSIMDQRLILSDDQSVREFCQKYHISIVHFKRFECSEGT